MITRSIKKNEVVTKTYVIDATNVRMGKLVAEIAKYSWEKYYFFSKIYS